MVYDYSDPSFIGKRNGYLIAVSKEGKYFNTVCDCGRHRLVSGTYLFRYKTVKSCGNGDCPYYRELLNNNNGREVRQRGVKAELALEKMFRDGGETVIRTKDSGDFGVDLILLLNNGHRMAIQCKMEQTGAGVDSIQQVYAGGRYYDCDSFAVICPYGFTSNAKLMASKLGVYLADTVFEYPDDMRAWSNNLLETLPEDMMVVENPRKTKWEIDGVVKTADEWCTQYKTTRATVYKRMKKGYTVKEALLGKGGRELYTVKGFTGNMREIGDHFGVIPQTIQYRMKYRNMSLEEAIFAQ